mmetsp:Transcript_29015/g.52493  ORF Transcript_29015/g.52493 Transcript_29015/m.52493 type:complete len:287 (-) Transcript_29015:78-938(-)|eukprot:CAMPEP_0202489320 /NCGR_PEP_ID=MMETSP1361-20130828/7081_1 /ASSEMBLY_ACC=CAM_ASM_000849 /TAXON_ID=210615 /ORGANISM="Staurosira complex sp., Strain CCMP2646" /LENGTH=286 /DNA_ID=CAMNT_0049119041 /DNA_START=101 /DNA_END=961 /DNA_ORIENTATION=-
MAEEATVNPDGSTTFEGAGDEAFNATEEEPIFVEEEVVKGVDPAIYLGLFVLILGLLWFFVLRSQNKEEDEFFAELDVEKFNLKLPDAVDEYYAIKEKVIEAGWEPGQAPSPGDTTNASGPHRVMAQALMKRCIADIPIVTHIQKESAGMNKLYSQSMCSVKQWRAYQAAEAMVSAEVDEVRAEADEIEPGWSQVIWRQAMQYHNMLKQKHEMEQKAAAEEAKKRKIIEERVNAEKKRMSDAEAKEKAAEQAAADLLKAEEREKESKQSFSGKGGMKKGFMDGKKK